MKKVTLAMIADRAGMTQSGVSKAIKRGNPRILTIAQELGYKSYADIREENAKTAAELKATQAESLREMAEIRKRGIVSTSTIAQDLQMSRHTVQAVLNGTKRLNVVNRETVEKIRMYAEMVGYEKTPNYVTRHLIFLEELGNFRSAAEFKAHMLKLRDRGYTNAEIAHKCGVAYNTILLYIGKQPKEYTAESMKIAGQHMKAKNAARKSRLKNFKAAERKRIDVEIEQTNAENVLHFKKIEENNKYIAELQARKAAL